MIRRRAGDVGAFADHDEVGFRPHRQRLQAAVARQRRGLGGYVWRQALHRGGDGGGVLGGGAATRADDVQPAGLGKLPQLLGHHLRGLVVCAEFIRQAGVGPAGDVDVGDGGDLLQIRAHQVGTQGAVDSHAEQIGVRDGVPERLRRLSGEVAPAGVDHRQRHDHGNPPAELGEGVLDAQQRRLGVERVEGGLG